jgi:curli production assembly/transport component CsgG
MEQSREEPIALKPRENLIEKLPELDGPSMTIAVYGFADKTGQMKPNDRLAVFSKAVTQGAEVFLIKSLQDSKNWFKVVERVGLDNLVKERQLIRNQREVYEGKDAKPLRPMTVAGIMIEGGIIGYDSNIRSGGNGARFLGIGGSQQYRVDEVVISLRLVSVNSGEVLLTNAVTKTIYSTQHNVGVLRFVDAGTKSLELENGMALNEPTTYAVRVAIEQAVYEMIVEGEKKGLWRFKKPKPVIVEPITVQPVIVPLQTAPVIVPEKKEDKKDELVQPQTAPQGRIETAPAAPQSDDGKTDGGNEKVSEVRHSTEANTPVSETEKKQGVIQDWVNIRTQKYRASETLAKLSPGTTVEVLELEQWFARVRFNTKEGWIPIQFIKVQK